MLGPLIIGSTGPLVRMMLQTRLLSTNDEPNALVPHRAGPSLDTVSTYEVGETMTDFQKCSLIIRAGGVLATLRAVAVAI